MRISRLTDLAVADLAARKAGATISVCLPARDEAATVGSIVALMVEHLVRGHRLVDEVVVVDDYSTDATAAVAQLAGARVVLAADVLPDCGPATGKGEALWKSLAACRGDLVVWCDADIVGFDVAFVTRLLAPLLLDPSVDFVKGCYRRDLHGQPDEGGRVTELIARPLIARLFPHLAGFTQPLSGEYAGRRSLLERLPFAPGYGVDLGLLVDVAAMVGVEAMAQVELGHRSHRNRPLRELTVHAGAVLATALERAGVVHPEASPAGLAWRPPLVEVAAYRDR
ncbi:glucosyl-3-phosphoglycerate synthase [soil metagenome]